MSPTETPEDQQIRQDLLNAAEQHGAAIVHVAEEEGAAPFAFSVGMWRRFGAPEAVIIGLPSEAAEHVLMTYLQRVNAGMRFKPGSVHRDLLPGCLVTVETVHLGYYPEFFGYAFLLYPAGDFPAIQLVATTPEGHWPWQDDAPAGFSGWQPILTESGYPESWTDEASPTQPE